MSPIFEYNFGIVKYNIIYLNQKNIFSIQIQYWQELKK